MNNLHKARLQRIAVVARARLAVELQRATAWLDQWTADPKNLWLALEGLILLWLLVLVIVSGRDVSPRAILTPPNKGAATMSHVTITDAPAGVHALFTFKANIVADENDEPIAANVLINNELRVVRVTEFEITVRQPETFEVTVVAPNRMVWSLRFTVHGGTPKTMQGTIRLQQALQTQ